MDNDTIQYYEHHASDVASIYEAVESPLASLFPFLFKKGQRVLDIGIGSGRDIAFARAVETTAVRRGTPRFDQ